MNLTTILEFIEFFKELFAPHIGSLIFNSLMYCFLGIIIIVPSLVFLNRKGFLKRKNTFHNILVKLYVPYMFILTLYIFGQIGVIGGIHDILTKENKKLLEQVYTNSIDPIINSSEKWGVFMNQLNTTANNINKNNDKLTLELLSESIKLSNSKNSLCEISDFNCV